MLNDLKFKTTPIRWLSFTNKSLQQAKIENKPIFLLITSIDSFWSDRMQKEISENQKVIELLNERFICIKVDKYKRPDIERYFQRVHYLLNRRYGGLPLSIFFTENLEPFYAGAYIAPKAMKELLGFEELLHVISKKYTTDYETLTQKGQEVLEFINPKEETIQATKLQLTITKTIKSQIKLLLDKEYGGFTKAPKFPNITTLELILDTYQLEKDKELLDSVELTLTNMAKGGFYDLENGGFYSYAKDREWRVAHEVKTTYNNATLANLYLRAYSITKKSSYKDIALKTIEYMMSQQKASKLFAIEEEITTVTTNAMMIRTLIKASTIDKKYLTYAIETLEATLSNFYIDGVLYHTLSKDKKEKIKAFLEDYTQLGETLIEVYQYTLDESFLIMATQFTNLIIEHYYQQANWFFSTNEFKIKETIHDYETPSSVASALSLLLSISSLVDINYKKFVFKTLELHSYNLMRQPLSSPKLSQILLRYLKDDIIIKANSNLLEKEIDKRETICYPYILFKNSTEEHFQLCNSNSCFAKENSFEEVKSYIESNL